MRSSDASTSTPNDGRPDHHHIPISTPSHHSCAIGADLPYGLPWAASLGVRRGFGQRSIRWRDPRRARLDSVLDSNLNTCPGIHRRGGWRSLPPAGMCGFFSACCISADGWRLVADPASRSSRSSVAWADRYRQIAMRGCTRWHAAQPGAGSTRGRSPSCCHLDSRDRRKAGLKDVASLD